MDREAGYYWVAFKHEKFEIGLWCNGYWHIIGSEDHFTDKDFDRIDETKIKHYNK